MATASTTGMTTYLASNFGTHMFLPSLDTSIESMTIACLPTFHSFPSRSKTIAATRTPPMSPLSPLFHAHARTDAATRGVAGAPMTLALGRVIRPTGQ